MFGGEPMRMKYILDLCNALSNTGIWPKAKATRDPMRAPRARGGGISNDSGTHSIHKVDELCFLTVACTTCLN